MADVNKYAKAATKPSAEERVSTHERGLRIIQAVCEAVPDGTTGWTWLPILEVAKEEIQAAEQAARRGALEDAAKECEKVERSPLLCVEPPAETVIKDRIRALIEKGE